MGPLSTLDALRVYKGKKVFVTGHTGFKGSWMTSLLLRLGAEVTGYALAPATKKNHFEMLGLEDQITHIEGDIRDAAKLSEALASDSFDIVFHLAAQALVRQSYQDPIETYETNVMGSVNLLEAVRNTPSIGTLIYVTSDKCYENNEWIWGYRENDAMGGHDPYSSSKAAAELVFSTYQRSFFLERSNFGAASVRAGNVVGGGDWAQDRIIPDCIRAIEAGTPIELRNPSATRPWQHVLEPICGYLVLGGNLHQSPDMYRGVWNFGPSSSESLNVGEVAQKIVDIFGQGSVNVPETLVHQHEAQLLQLNCDKAHQLLKWQPRWGALRTLEETAQWYKSVGQGQLPRDVTQSQIEAFFPELQLL